MSRTLPSHGNFSKTNSTLQQQRQGALVNTEKIDNWLMQDYLKHVSTVDNSYWEQIDQAIKKLKTLPDQEIKLILHQSRNNQLILDYLEIYGVDNEALFSYPLNSFRDYFLGELGVDRRLSDIVAQKLEQIYKERLGMYAPDALGFSETEQSSLGIHFPTVLALYDKLKNSFKTYLSTVSTLAQAKDVSPEIA